MLRCGIYQYVAIPLIKQVVTLFRNLKTTGVIISFSSATKLEASLHLASYHVNRLEVTQWEAPVRGLRDQTEGKIRCTVAASLHPHSHRAHSHACTPVMAAGGRTCTATVCLISTYMPVHVRGCVSSALHHSFLSLSLFRPFFCVNFLNPSHLVLISFFFSLPLALSHKNMHVHPSIHPRTQLARASPREPARFGMGLCKEIQKSLRHHCLMVSPWQLREQGPALQCQTNTAI